LKWILGESIGSGFGNYWAYIIGTGELIVSLMLLTPIIFYIGKSLGFLKKKATPEFLFGLGGLWASAMMAGAVFFHVGTPLGIEVNGDGGSLFRAAVSILILGIALAITHKDALIDFTKHLPYVGK